MTRGGRREIIGSRCTRPEYDMLHVVLTRDGAAQLDNRRLRGVVNDVRRALYPELTDAELALVDIVHPVQEDYDGRDGQTEFFQRVETCP